MLGFRRRTYYRGMCKWTAFPKALRLRVASMAATSTAPRATVLWTTNDLPAHAAQSGPRVVPSIAPTHGRRALVILRRDGRQLEKSEATTFFEKCRRSLKDSVCPSSIQSPLLINTEQRRRSSQDQTGSITAPTTGIAGDRESRCAPACRGKRHVSTRFHVHPAISLSEMPIGNDALPHFALARGT
jgi:hypothetical protein